MAMEYRTKTDRVKVYNSRGTHTDTIQQANTLVVVVGAAVDVAGRGGCFPVTNPKIGFVQVGDLKVTTVSNPPPVDPPPVVEKPIYLTAHYKDGASERYVPE